mmetsp:Transcript_26486/g.58067  ORF Transcript_26486/g.58067 Transcript_26486/m.58067 type:complete len:111 (-) Transcript_26486:319-651(-)|eukprot:CAMPEP_0178502386 /NCGR_PEP_ID=MMETSP0696-20121128/17477_1 /TAXON_ID=265572 /ORGANISM="Extubocellulus spinifer, Strain CCMP396" /LENGTH=110 /DNA_ID=CAMNT_0020131441 /DNA_START=183 /DNA_END=515 /DNA_ORIENTATION=+
MPRGKSRSKSPVPKSKKKATAVGGDGGSLSSSDLPSAGYLLTCDPPTTQFVKHLNETKRVGKKFIIEELDATHLLIKGNAREEVLSKVEEWMDANVFTNVERVGENLDTS